MRTRVIDKIPRCFGDHPSIRGLLAEACITPVKTRLKAKLLIFKDNKSLRHCWKHCLEKEDVDLTRDTLGVVSDTATHVINFRKGKQELEYWQTDRRYFCVIGLIKGHLTMEIITHEAVHAAFALVARGKRKQWHNSDNLDEEEVCYPAGQIAAAINSFLDKKGLYK